MTIMTDAKPSAMDAGMVKIGRFLVNRMGFGAMRLTGPGIWGPPADSQSAKQLLRYAVASDINFIDTADAYGPEVSEQLIHDALYPYEGLIIATKGGMVRSGPNMWHTDGRPEHLRDACEASLKRLGVDQITLYQFHRPDPTVPFKQSMQALVSLKQEGKIRHLGVSNVSLEQLQHAMDMTDIVSVQNHYNLLHRRDGDKIIDFCEANGIAFIPYFPIGGSKGDITDVTVQKIATHHGATPQQISLAWLLARSPILLPIPGTSSLSHLEENIAAASIKLSEEEMSQLNNLSD